MTALITIRQLENRIGYKKTSVYDRMDPASPRYDPSFPAPVRFGTGAVRWVETEVDAWVQAQIDRRDAQAAAKVAGRDAQAAAGDAVRGEPPARPGRSPASRSSSRS